MKADPSKREPLFFENVNRVIVLLMHFKCNIKTNMKLVNLQYWVWSRAKCVRST